MFNRSRRRQFRHFLSRLRHPQRLIRRFFHKTHVIKDEPLNRVSLAVILVIDLFILINVFTGLNDIGRWPISPYQAYPCYGEWQSYLQQTDANRDFNFLQPIANDEWRIQEGGYRVDITRTAENHLGEVADICLRYADYQDQIATPANRQIILTLAQKDQEVNQLTAANQEIRNQYDSTLLEQIAGQPVDQSINTVEAAQARQTLEDNNAAIATLRDDIRDLQAELVNQPESQDFLTFVQSADQFAIAETGYERASFWYPSRQLFFQGLFLLPLIAITGIIHRASQRRNYGLVSLMTWHLLVIFSIPLLIKVFQFLQVGALFSFLFDLVSNLLGGLLFLVSYAYILVIPLLGFAIIKLSQRYVFNPQVQAANRVEKSRCLRCARKIQAGELHCPHCGYEQRQPCPHCHGLTYKHLPHCVHCGHPQPRRSR
jgi:hypothetical protein